MGQFVERGWPLRPGEIYAVLMPDGIVIKRLRFSDNDDELVLQSDNDQYDPYPVRKTDIMAMSRRVMVFDLSAPNYSHGTTKLIEQAARQLAALSDRMHHDATTTESN